MKRQSLLFNIFLSLGSLLLCVALAEGVSRMILKPPELISIVEDSYTPLSSEGKIEAKRMPDYELYYNTPTGMRLRRNAHLIVKDHRLSHRDTEIRTFALRNFLLYFVLLSVRYQVEAEILMDYPQKRFEKLMADYSIPHLDLLPILRAVFRETSRDLYFDHCHMREPGNRTVGQAIAQFLLDHL